MSDQPDGHAHAEPSPDEITEELEHLHDLEDDAATVAVERDSRTVRGLHRFRLGIEAVNGFLGGISQVLVWVVFLMGLFNVVTRYSSRWLERDLIIGEMFEGQSMVFSFLALLGLGYGMREGVNPRVDFWWAEFSDKRKARIDFYLHLVLFLPFCWMSIKVLWTPTMRSLGQNLDGSWDTWRVWDIWEQSPDASGLPRAPVRAGILFGFLILFAQTIAEMIKTGFIVFGYGHVGAVTERDAPLRVE